MTKYTSPLTDLNAGFAVDLSSCADARSPLKALFLCVDFPNCRAADSPHPDTRYYYDILAGEGLRLYEKMSYGRFRMTVTLCGDWVTMPKNDADYQMERVITWETHRRYIQDAFDAVPDLDFGAYDIVYIAAVEGSAVPYSPTMAAKGWPVRAKNGTGCGLVVTFGADMHYRRGKLFCHENGHILGLPDLYLYDVPEGVRDCFAHCGPFDLMGLIEGSAPDYLGYHKWRLGWIDDDQVTEFGPGESGRVELTPIEVPGGMKLVNLPLSREAGGEIDGENGYIAEYRAPMDPDGELERDGVILYKISGRVQNGAGCVTLIPPEPEKYLRPDPRSSDGLILPGVTLTRDGIRLTHEGGGVVRIERR